MLARCGDALGRWLERESAAFQPYTPSDFETLSTTLRVGDVLLVEGRAQISTAIKYLTQGTWSHAAVYVGEMLPPLADGGEPDRLVEVTLAHGCAAAPLSKYARHNTRICRAVTTPMSGAANAATALYTPRDFDLSPYFAVVKPLVARGFDHSRIRWAEADKASRLG